jgi:ClpX C4-type zinc finger
MTTGQRPASASNTDAPRPPRCSPRDTRQCPLAAADPTRALSLALRIGLLLAALLTGAGVALTIFPPRRKPGEDDHESEPAQRQRIAAAQGTTASERFQAALDACQGLPARLTRLAEAAEAKGGALRARQRAGFAAAPQRVDPEWRPPWELRHDSPRLPVIAWQLLDRAFDQLTATLDDPDADLAARAAGYDQLAKAARHVAQQLEDDDGHREMSSALARCAFCGKPARDVQKIIAGPTSAICDECVDLCNCILEDEFGDSWRDPRPD